MVLHTGSVFKGSFNFSCNDKLVEKYTSHLVFNFIDGKELLKMFVVAKLVLVIQGFP